MYDYYLGGKDNYAADRAAAERAIEAVPGLRELARANRRFLGRVVAHLAASGIGQFIDLGTGLPTQRNVHEVAREIDPLARVVYVDNDPTVLAHARALLAADDRTQVIGADVRDVDGLLARPELGDLIDFDRPVAVLMFALLHTFNADADPYGFVRRFTDTVVPGSMLAISHAAAGVRPET
ncbi:MAG: hypothetical protein GEV11_21400 [Streptosporangiales bacterium]|nr:hypothetical protein [Streptosporangiales bacterium]